MKIEELLKFNDIVIQCHDNPDADAIASGYGIYTYLKENGKNPRFIYGGRLKISKSNLVLLRDMLQIPIEHTDKLEEPELLVTVDCRYGQSNVQGFSGKTVAVIDHHQVPDKEVLPELHEIHSNYGSCSTIIWKMLTEAGYDVNGNRELATALYYGLYMDTSKLQEISHPMDKDMRDELKVDKRAILHFQNSNLSLEELEIASKALADYRYNETWKYSLVEAEECDPNILGVISDMLMEVDVVNTCIAYCRLNNGIKLSVRSCIREAKADDLARFVTGDIGNGGGHLTKAGGFLSGDKLIKKYEGQYGKEKICSLSRLAYEWINSRMEEYFREETILDVKDYRPDISNMDLYRKKPVRIGYVEAEKIFPVGTQVLVRMLEGDVEIAVEEGVRIMIGVEHEIYPSRIEKFRESYEETEDPYVMEGEYLPTIRNTLTGEARKLLPYARCCESKDTSQVYGCRLKGRTKLFTAWDRDKYVLGDEGDWLVVRKDDLTDMYLVKRDIFARIYEECH